MIISKSDYLKSDKTECLKKDKTMKQVKAVRWIKNFSIAKRDVFRKVAEVKIPCSAKT